MAWLLFHMTLLIMNVFVTGSTEIEEDFALDVTEICIKKCPFQNHTEDVHYDFGCGGDCGIEQLCNSGCSLWTKALETSCQTVCNVTTDVVAARELYCVMGCNEALNHYFQGLKEKIGTPPAPALVADSLTSTSLSLEWEGSRHSNLSYLVQWRYEEVAGAWQYYRNQTWGNHSIVRVENLQPFTKYRFRIAVLLSPRHSDPIVSAPSVVISTLPLGPPSSPPVELRVTALDSHRISLSWEPGPFPNGHILSYVLTIAQIPKGYSAIKDLRVSENSLFYMFPSLSPSSSYRVSVAMRNAVGEGPQATVMVTTPALPAVVANQQPVLILGGMHSVVQQPADILEPPKFIYNSSNVIQGVGIDVGRDLLFVSDSSGSVFKSSLSSLSPSKAILTPSTIPYTPLDLSVDWLNGHLYILGEVNHNKGDGTRGNMNNFVRWQIMRSDFDGKAQTVAFAGFHFKPVHIEVDPYNGYLFWAIRGPSGGLYRLDLADISNGVKHDIIPDQILKDSNLGAFTVDHTNFRILVPHLKKNTVLAVSLDGREKTDIRNNTQNAMFSSVQSLAYANGLFYWTDGESVITEEYHQPYDSYFHNEFPDKQFNSVMIALRSSQPIPVAVNPPTGLQSVMGEHEACVSWRAPHRLGPQGAGAWQHWAYTLYVTEAANNATLYKIDVNSSTSYTARDLKDDTVYVIKVAAVTSSGTGPWSSEFTAQTLSASHSGVPSSMLWSTDEGILMSDLTGHSVHTLVHKSQLNGMFITDISWFEDRLYLVANSSNVMWYNTTSGDGGWLPDMDNVGSLAVDWIGGKLYWSSPKQQLITRGNLDGGSREPVPIVTVGKELKVDSLEGFIYWNTGHAIECARLNGEHKFTYYPAQLFRKQVMGLTVDLNGKLLYWIVHGYEGTNLYKAPTADVLEPGNEVSGTLITSLSGATILGPLCYFSNRLIWLQDNTQTIIADLKGQNRAILNAVTMTYINMIAVIDPNLQTSPVDSHKINVIPESVDHDSIKILGNWDSYNITWDPIKKINYGEVFYEIKIEFDHRIHKEYITSEALIEYSGSEVPPYSLIEMWVRAYTYWGAAVATRVTLRSPQALPTPPTRPRAFVLHHTDILSNTTEVSVVFRWERPHRANGLVMGYRVECHHLEGSCFAPGNLSAKQLEYVTRGALNNTTYFLQVQAFTDAGYGPKSQVVTVDTTLESPIPKLAISYYDSIKVADLDLGDGYTYTISRSAGKPEDFAVSMREGLLFWINQEQEIYVSRMDETGHTKMLSINGTALSIAVDWVARMLFWSQIENTPDQYECVVYRMDLNVYDKDGIIKLQRILQRNMHVKKLQVSPITRSLYWIEVNHHGLGKMMTSDIDGANIRPFFNDQHYFEQNISQSPDQNKLCNCPENPAVGLGFTVDLTDIDDKKIYWVDAWLKHITVSDLFGCHCKVVVNATRYSDRALPPSSLTVDSHHVYWTNSSQRQLYSVDKIHGSIHGVNHINITNGQKILALGSKIQPYPPNTCLYPKQVPLQISVTYISATSFTLSMPNVVKYKSCENYDIATPYYTMFYQPYVDDETKQCNETACTTIRTYDKTFRLDNLRPFSKYVFSVQVNNFYGDLSDLKPVMGPPIIFRTSAGAPASANNVVAQVLSPHLARVEWSTPSPPGVDSVDPDLWYEIHWKTEGSFTPNQGVKEHTFIAKTKLPLSQTVMQADLPKLLPSQSYSVWVRTHSNNTDVYTDSENVSIETFPEPSHIMLTLVEPYFLHVSWLPYKKVKTTEQYIEYAEMGYESWKRVQDMGSQKKDGSINYIIDNLLPKTQYKFRVKIFYVNNTIPYVWPQDNLFVFETSGDRPSPPGKPVVQHLSGSVYQLQWTPSEPNGCPVGLYRLFGHAQPSEGEKIRTHRDIEAVMKLEENISLVDDNLLRKTTYNNFETVVKDGEFDFSHMSNEGQNRLKREANYTVPQSDLPHFSVEDNSDSMIVEENDEPLKDGWKLLYNGTDNYWIIAELKLSERYTFYVQAFNLYGWSDFSEPSDPFDFSEADLMSVPQDIKSAIILGTGISILVALIFSIAICICFIRRRDKKLGLINSTPIISGLRGPDVELATLRELPRSRGGGGMFQQSIIYGQGGCGNAGGITECDIAQLPHIPRDQITLTKFLGSGAFGEVFQGKAKVLGEGSSTRVAVKTLRKGATDQEKTEFLQEAQLMSNFRHQHILSLLGVCLDNDPHFIIMELMEAGDLLSYLRSRRPMLYTNDSLTLRDLLSMCLDVTRGCCYLEELHFVHRDLACRNCLVSHQPQGRIVKIGDFGLARDIYKNDYYRKEGEGLLPVRWMAVECLTDGVFSRASDVWAWAVLCWEVAALGRQPYPALPNHAVMRYVRAGGTLPRPSNCPLPLFQLMQKCWTYNPDHRPTFKHCLEVLENIMETIDHDVALTAIMNEEPQYISVVADGFSNRAYFMDINQNNFSEDMDFINENVHNSPETSQGQDVTVEGPPKYLELIYDSDTPPPCVDGYEVPRASIRRATPRSVVFNTDDIDHRGIIQRRHPINRFDNRHSMSRIQENRKPSNQIERRRSFNQHSTFNPQLHSPNGLRVKVFEPNMNSVIYHNSCMGLRSSNSFGRNDSLPNTSQRIVPNGIMKKSISRNNSLSSRVSDEERMLSQAQGEQKRLLNNTNCATGFTMPNSDSEMDISTIQKVIT